MYHPRFLGEHLTELLEIEVSIARYIVSLEDLLQIKLGHDHANFFDGPLELLKIDMTLI